jgi:hypothetical protein
MEKTANFGTADTFLNKLKKKTFFVILHWLFINQRRISWTIHLCALFMGFDA